MIRQWRRPWYGRTAAVVATATAGVASSLVWAPAAGAATVQDATESFRNQATNLCVEYLTIGYSDQTFSCDGSPGQQWDVHVWRDGTRQLRGHNPTGQCISDDAARGVDLNPCDASRGQSWWVHRWNDGTIELRNQATNRCLEDNNGYLRTSGCNSSRNQSWR